MLYHFAGETPKLKLKAREISVIAGDPLEMKVDVSGAPEPTVEWQKDGVSVEELVKSNYNKSTNPLTLLNRKYNLSTELALHIRNA